MLKKIICAILTMALLTAFAGCGKKTQPRPTVQTQAPTETTPPQPTDPTKPTVAENDVFGGEHFDEMLWGYYEAADYAYTGDLAEDTAKFRENMAYLQALSQYGELRLSALPLDMQLGSYSQFMDIFSYEGKYYSPCTETGKAMFRKAYMAQFGDLTEEDFQKIEKLLALNVARMTFVQPDGDTQLRTFAYEIRENALILSNMSVDEQFNVSVGDEFARYYFLHDGGKLTLDYGGIRREYLANGYKAGECLQVAGFAQDRSKQYKNLEGFVLQQQQDGEGFQIDVILSNDAKPVDPVVTFDKTTGQLNLSWTKSAYASGEVLHSTPRTISGRLIPCAGYGFNDFSGFYLIIDGTCYSYLVSEEEYRQRRYTNLENGDVIPDLQREKLSHIKINMLAELEQAYNIAEIPVDVDFLRGQITVEADYLFGDDSYDISQDGQDFLQRLMEIYASVLLKEEYVKYVSRIVIEGHTDAAGQYSQKKEMSDGRAAAMAKSCADQAPDFGKNIQSVGCAYDYPVYNDDGSVNTEKSNRMVFRFLLKDN